MTAFTEARHQQHAGYAEAALQLSGMADASTTNVQTACDALMASMRTVWKLPWDNKRKEILWRLALHGVPGAGGHGISLAGPCPCGWAPPAGAPHPDLLWRSHYFWECRVAQSVATAVRDGLSAHGTHGGTLTARHVWLLTPPAATVYPPVWQVVCIAALGVMEYGRSRLWAQHLDTPALPVGQTLITAYMPTATAGPAPPDLPEGVGRAAVARFWSYLQVFVDAQLVPTAWVADPVALGPLHPFIGVVRSGTPPRLCLHAPAMPL